MNSRVFLLLALCFAPLLLTSCHPFEELSDYPFDAPSDGAGCVPAEQCPNNDCDLPICTLEDATSEADVDPPEDVPVEEDAVDAEVVDPCGGDCLPGQACCGGSCVEVTENPENCGVCGNVCEDSESCLDGACTLVCDGELTNCGDRCVDLFSSDDNCGLCGKVCADDQVCSKGECACLRGTANCHDGEVVCETNLTLDTANCGACGVACDTVEECLGGTCTCGASDVCAVGASCCKNDRETFCTSLESDPRNCGECGNVCGAGEACRGGKCLCGDGARCEGGNVCCSGQCAPPEGELCLCAGGACPGICCDNACIENYLEDKQNCGACGNVCEGALVCVGGGCACPELGQTFCGDAGCVDTSSDVENCGFCGSACGNGQECCGGICAAINTGVNCGECGNICGPNEVCDGNGCVCAVGYDDCDGDPTNGCEVLLVTGSGDGTEDCGECGNTCFDNMTCRQGQCGCLRGYRDCNQESDDGCEVDINVGVAQPDGSTDNCGMCGVSCKPNQTCSVGLCLSDTNVCATGRGDCDGDSANGCEADLLNGTLIPESDRNGPPQYTNCGACRKTCNPGEACVAGECTCPTGALSCGTLCWQGAPPTDPCTKGCNSGCGLQQGICDARGQCLCCTEVTISTETDPPGP